ncbi:DsbA family protein [Janthinobacterium sp. 17J80-10]|uniref:DsbA family protein n=1 Tax=Janthinobacterium sp. 17J80-10 TaxID=2497863 RepID=UPI0010053A17|nr:DsbA family protein [Janthinobacterium sp. 17J80-10]QAU35427.1 DsbA family protein [Janthinobacterium sp. 17J80-10]
MATNLIFIADPMCSWCYGFAPELDALQQGLPEVPVEIVLGGLRTQQQPLDADGRQLIHTHWEQVQAATGLTFSSTALDTEGFIYDTEPACRAVVTARGIAAQTSLPVFHAIQQAFYAEGRDVTQAAILAEVAAQAMSNAGHAIDAGQFQEIWSSAAMVDATQADFALTRNWDVQGFPTLVLERGRDLDLVTSGFVTMPVLVERLEELVEQQAAA